MQGSEVLDVGAPPISPLVGVWSAPRRPEPTEGLWLWLCSWGRGPAPAGRVWDSIWGSPWANDWGGGDRHREQLGHPRVNRTVTTAKHHVPVNLFHLHKNPWRPKPMSHLTDKQVEAQRDSVFRDSVAQSHSLVALQGCRLTLGPEPGCFYQATDIYSEVHTVQCQA